MIKNILPGYAFPQKNFVRDQFMTDSTTGDKENMFRNKSMNKLQVAILTILAVFSYVALAVTYLYGKYSNTGTCIN